MLSKCTQAVDGFRLFLLLQRFCCCCYFDVGFKEQRAIPVDDNAVAPASGSLSPLALESTRVLGDIFKSFKVMVTGFFFQHQFSEHRISCVPLPFTDLCTSMLTLQTEVADANADRLRQRHVINGLEGRVSGLLSRATAAEQGPLCHNNLLPPFSSTSHWYTHAPTLARFPRLYLRTH
jgi:hypothetical protein